MSELGCLLSRTDPERGRFLLSASAPVIFSSDFERNIAMRLVFFLVCAGWLTMIGASSFAIEVSETDSVKSNEATGEVIVQIFGRRCEYHREDVETALRPFNGVRQVKFLNDLARCWYGISPIARRQNSLPTRYIGRLRQAGTARRGWIGVREHL